MNRLLRAPTIVVISGSIATGKSTLSRAVASDLANGGTRSAVIDIDLLHDMLSEGQDPTWAIARQAAGALASAFLAAGVQVVVIDGEFISPKDRSALLDAMTRTVTARFVTLRVGYHEALRRARSDPTRRLSADPAFLRSHYASVEAGLDATPATDLVIDTERLSLAEAISALREFVGLG